MTCPPTLGCGVPDDLRLLPAGRAVGRPAARTNLANAITCGRICLLPAAVWLVWRGACIAALWLFLAEGVWDSVAVWLASWRGPTALGALLDPIADKVLLVSMYVTLAQTWVLPDWLAILVVFRDAVIVGGVLTLSLHGLKVAIRPLLVSKHNTVLRIVLVGAALLASCLALASAPIPALVTALIWIVTASTLISGGAYVAQATMAR